MKSAAGGRPPRRLPHPTQPKFVPHPTNLTRNQQAGGGQWNLLDPN